MVKKCKELSESDKWIVSLMSAILFVVISSPFMYRLTNSLTEAMGFVTSNNGCPKIEGLVLHTVVFALLVRLLMLIRLKKN
jgi:hypothetical protein